jgi:hypothetical protein
MFQTFQQNVHKLMNHGGKTIRLNESDLKCLNLLKYIVAQTSNKFYSIFVEVSEKLLRSTIETFIKFIKILFSRETTI